MDEPNQRREDLQESENIISNAEPNEDDEDFKENNNSSNNSEQLTFKEFEADVMDSSLIHDSSYRVQSSQEDNEAFVSAVEEFTDGSADVTLTGNDRTFYFGALYYSVNTGHSFCSYFGN